MTNQQDNLDPKGEIQLLKENMLPHNIAKIFCEAVREQKSVDFAIREVIRETLKTDVETREIIYKIIEEHRTKRFWLGRKN